MKSIPPVCPKIPKTFIEHGTTREDPYFWLREKEDPKVKQYVEAENEYFENLLAPLKKTEEGFFEELKTLIEPELIEVPYRLGPYEYWSKTPPEASYSIHYRKLPGSNHTETLLDLNVLAAKEKYLELQEFNPNFDHTILAYALDTDGSERNKIYFKDLQSGNLLGDILEGTYGQTAWSTDGHYIFYTKLNAQDRPDQIFRHQLGTPQAQDVLIYQEKDPRFFIGVGNSKNGQWIFIETHSKESSEVFLISGNSPLDTPKSFEPRTEDHQYSIENQGDRFLIVSNRGERNYKLFTATQPGDPWRELVSGNAETDLRSLEVFKDAYALLLGDQGTLQIQIYNSKDQPTFKLDLDEPTYDLGFSNNHEYNLNELRYCYSSFKIPLQTWELDLTTGKKRNLHKRLIPGLNPDLYVTKKEVITSHDGVKVPVSMVHRKDLKLPAPTIILAYGAYGISYPAGFRAQAIQMANHGFVFAIAHIRGGGCLGQRWYDEGKFLKKKNSFLDLIAAGEGLIQKNITKSGELSISGGSAGGLLMGATMNLRPDLFKSVVAIVPFVDVMNTMMDETLPLTPTEFDEWGNPKDKKYYDYILGYSPYDNVEEKAYPHLFMTCGWNDPRVTYWEPAKFAARIRERRTDQGLTLLKTNMGAGHAGQSGRFEGLKEYAQVDAFLYAVHFRPELLQPV